jgi:hypothetical protein
MTVLSSAPVSSASGLIARTEESGVDPERRDKSGDIAALTGSWLQRRSVSPAEAYSQLTAMLPGVTIGGCKKVLVAEEIDQDDRFHDLADRMLSPSEHEVDLK